mmetsp:Transcript_47172/g.102681  ORF Transcript_47172/g.102681 Transcript_47172/m.102681 type:complete len:301 (-) Transcript_47172:39-941(-)
MRVLCGAVVVAAGRSSITLQIKSSAGMSEQQRNEAAQHGIAEWFESIGLAAGGVEGTLASALAVTKVDRSVAVNPVDEGMFGTFQDEEQVKGPKPIALEARERQEALLAHKAKVIRAKNGKLEAIQEGFADKPRETGLRAPTDQERVEQQFGKMHHFKKQWDDIDDVEAGEVHHSKEIDTPPAHSAARPMLSSQKVHVSTAATQKTQKQMSRGMQQFQQCLAYTQWLQMMQVSGPELVRMMKATCTDGVLKGKPTPAYSQMCEAIGAAASPYVIEGSDWSPDALCTDVMRVFDESGVGLR